MLFISSNGSIITCSKILFTVSIFALFVFNSLGSITCVLVSLSSNCCTISQSGILFMIFSFTLLESEQEDKKQILRNKCKNIFIVFM